MKKVVCTVFELTFKKLMEFYPADCTMQEIINKFEREVGEGCVHDRIRVPSMDQLRNLDPGEEGYIKCIPVY